MIKIQYVKELLIKKEISSISKLLKKQLEKHGIKYSSFKFDFVRLNDDKELEFIFVYDQQISQSSDLFAKEIMFQTDGYESIPSLKEQNSIMFVDSTIGINDKDLILTIHHEEQINDI